MCATSRERYSISSSTSTVLGPHLRVSIQTTGGGGAPVTVKRRPLFDENAFLQTCSISRCDGWSTPKTFSPLQFWGRSLRRIEKVSPRSEENLARMSRKGFSRFSILKALSSPRLCQPHKLKHDKEQPQSNSTERLLKEKLTAALI